MRTIVVFVFCFWGCVLSGQDFNYAIPDAYVSKLIKDIQNGVIRKSPELGIVEDDLNRLSFFMMQHRFAKEGDTIGFDRILELSPEYFELPNRLDNIEFVKRDDAKETNFAMIEDISKSYYWSSSTFKKIYPTYDEFREGRLKNLRAKDKFEFLSKDLVRYYYPVTEITYIYSMEIDGGYQLFVVDLINYGKGWKVGTMFNFKSEK